MELLEDYRIWLCPANDVSCLHPRRQHQAMSHHAPQSKALENLSLSSRCVQIEEDPIVSVDLCCIDDLLYYDPTYYVPVARLR